jgi:hypothetical protein
LPREPYPSQGLAPRDVATFLEKAWGLTEEARPSAASTYEVTTLYNQFYLEPKAPNTKHAKAYFDDPQDVERGYSLRGDSVALSTPTESEACAVSLHIDAPPAKIKGAAQVVTFSLEVGGDLYLRSADDGSDDNRYVVPPGSYDVTVAFRRRKGRKSADGLDHYDVDVWLVAT